MPRLLQRPTRVFTCQFLVSLTALPRPRSAASASGSPARPSPLPGPSRTSPSPQATHSNTVGTGPPATATATDTLPHRDWPAPIMIHRPPAQPARPCAASPSPRMATSSAMVVGLLAGSAARFPEGGGRRLRTVVNADPSPPPTAAVADMERTIPERASGRAAHSPLQHIHHSAFPLTAHPPTQKISSQRRD